MPGATRSTDQEWFENTIKDGSFQKNKKKTKAKQPIRFQLSSKTNGS